MDADRGNDGKAVSAWASLLLVCLCAGGGCNSLAPSSQSVSIPTPSNSCIETRPTATAAPLPEGIGPPAAPAAVVPTAASERSIDLATALELAGAENATIARALEAVRSSLALELQARAQ